MKKIKGLILITLLSVFFIGINSITHAAPLAYDWTIEKAVDQTNLTLDIGEEFLVTYTVTVHAFGAPDGDGLIDDFADIDDDKYGFLGTVDANWGTAEFVYTMLLGNYSEPGIYSVFNTASLTTNDTGVTHSNTREVIIEVLPDTEPVPEPATMFLLGTGLVGVAGVARRKKKNQA